MSVFGLSTRLAEYALPGRGRLGVSLSTSLGRGRVDWGCRARAEAVHQERQPDAALRSQFEIREIHGKTLQMDCLAATIWGCSSLFDQQHIRRLVDRGSHLYRNRVAHNLPVLCRPAASMRRFRFLQVGTPSVSYFLRSVDLNVAAVPKSFPTNMIPPTGFDECWADAASSRQRPSPPGKNPCPAKNPGNGPIPSG